MSASDGFELPGDARHPSHAPGSRFEAKEAGLRFMTGCAAATSDLRAFALRAPVRLLIYLLVAFSFVFMAFPGIDLAVSGWFAGPSGSFPLSDDDTLVLVRDINRLIPKLLIPGLVAILLLHAFRPQTTWLVRPHQALYVVSVYALGGGVVVHFLKNFVGRARPEDVLAFGGSDVFTVAWQLSGACLRNCSFSSGEAASAIAMLSAIVMVPSFIRRPLFWLLLPFAVFFSLNRVAFGSHFLSDVVISWLLVSIVAVVLWRVFSAHGARVDLAVIGAGRPLAARLARGMSVLVNVAGPRTPLPPQ